LNLFPKALLDELTAAAEKAGFFLTTVMPVPALLQNQLTELPSKDTEIIALAAETGDSTTVLVGRSDGRVLLARTLASTWNGNLSRMALDLKRTLLYVNQQFGVNVSTVWLFGPNAAQHAPAVQEQVQLPVQPSPVEYTNNYWATEVLRSSIGEAQNLITREQQLAPQRRLAAQVLAFTSVLIVLTAVSVAYYLHRLEITQKANLLAAEREIASQQTRRGQLEDQHADLARRKEMVGVVMDGRNPPLAGWMLAYLSEAVPSSLVVTNLSFQREEHAWRLRLGGTLQAGAEGAPPGALATALGSLTNRLASGPFRVAFLPPPDTTNSTAASAAASTNWLSRLGVGGRTPSTPPPTPSPAVAPVQTYSFLVEGMVQP
jgi:hypothetical protein